jgi:hypothetical protein
MVNCSPVAFNDIKRLARSMPADGLEAQDVVPGHFPRGDRFLGNAGPPRPAFPAFLAGAARPLLPSVIDYSMFSQLAAARGSIISGPVSRSATAFNFLHSGPNSAYASFDYPESGRISFPRQVSRRQAAQGTRCNSGSGPVPDGAKLFLAFGSHRGAVREFRCVAAPGPDMTAYLLFAS